MMAALQTPITVNAIAILLPNLRAGGAEKVMINLANELVRRGHAVDLVVISASGNLRNQLAQEIKLHELGAGRIRGAFFPLVSYLRQAKPKAMLACMWPLTVLSVLAKWLAGSSTRLVVAEHTTWSRSEMSKSILKRWQIKNSMRYIFPFAEHVVAVSRGAADDLSNFARIDRESICVIYNPVVRGTKTPSAHVLPPHEWWVGSHKRVLAVGTLKRVKDYGTLIDAFTQLRRTIEARLLILGEGECRMELERKIVELDLHDSVFMPGFVMDATPYYYRADLLVLSSTNEGLPTVIIEALDTGTPVVSTDCPSGPREILGDGEYGRLVPVGDSAALARAMFDTLRSPCDASALRQRAQLFSVDDATSKYETLLGVL